METSTDVIFRLKVYHNCTKKPFGLIMFTGYCQVLLRSKNKSLVSAISQVVSVGLISYSVCTCITLIARKLLILVDAEGHPSLM